MIGRTTTRGRTVAAIAALTLALSVGPAVADDVATRGGHERQGHHGWGQRPGHVVSNEPLPQDLWLPNTAEAYRLEYHSTGFDGSRIVVSGAVFVPEGHKPRRGWPVISWAHGTVGSADVCAPSVAGRSERDRDFLAAWLAEGYAVVATDYEGLGTPGPHPYTHGQSQAYGVVDMVRAARSVDRSLSRSWMVVGQSQGGQSALVTGSLASDYAPELDFRGTIATAPLSQIRMNAEGLGFLDPASPAFAYIPLVVGGHKTAYGDEFAASEILTDAGAPIYLRSQEVTCLAEIVGELDGLQMQDVFQMEGEKLDAFLDQWSAYADIPIARYDRPVLIAQGTADVDVYPQASITTADELEAAGSDVTLLLYEGADHSGPMLQGVQDFLDFAQEQFQRRS